MAVTERPSPPDVGDLVQRASSLRQEFARTAAEVDAQGKDSTENMRRVWEEGLFQLSVPREFGGVCGDRIVSEWPELAEVRTQLCAGEGGTGMNFGAHSTVSRQIFYQGRGDLTEETLRFLASDILEHGARLVASNAETGAGQAVTGRRVPGGIIVNGTKTFNSNSGGTGWANVSLALEGLEGKHHALIPLDGERVTRHGDWDNMGERSTVSQSITYENVFVEDGWHYHVHRPELAMSPGVLLLHSATILGVGLGAYDAALEFVRTRHRTITPGITDPAQDPLVTRHLGVWSANLAAAHALQSMVAERVEAFQGARPELVRLVVESYRAKVASINAALEVGTGLFDLTGARGTSNTFRFDRFWRDARTFATHDPTDQKLIGIGAYDLAEVEPAMLNRPPTA